MLLPGLRANRCNGLPLLQRWSSTDNHIVTRRENVQSVILNSYLQLICQKTSDDNSRKSSQTFSSPKLKGSLSNST